MVSKKIRLLIVVFFIFLVPFAKGANVITYTSLYGAEFKIFKNRKGELVGNIIGSDLFYKDGYCESKDMYFCMSLGVLKITLPKREKLTDGAIWVGEFGEKNSVRYLGSIKILGTEIDNVFAVMQDWHSVDNSVHDGTFLVIYSENKGVIAFKGDGKSSETWFASGHNGWK